MVRVEQVLFSELPHVLYLNMGKHALIAPPLPMIDPRKSWQHLPEPIYEARHHIADRAITSK
jgi:hypothetical protein